LPGSPPQSERRTVSGKRDRPDVGLANDRLNQPQITFKLTYGGALSKFWEIPGADFALG